MRFWRRRRKALPIGEAEAYEHSYGDRSHDVRVVEPVAPSASRRPRFDVLRRGEQVRRAFEDRLSRRR